MTKRALVVGITGIQGSAVAVTLVRDGWGGLRPRPDARTAGQRDAGRSRPAGT